MVVRILISPNFRCMLDTIMSTNRAFASLLSNQDGARTFVIVCSRYYTHYHDYTGLIILHGRVVGEGVPRSVFLFQNHLSSLELKLLKVIFSDRLSTVCLYKLFTFSSFSPESLGHFEPNLAQRII